MFLMNTAVAIIALVSSFAEAAPPKGRGTKTLLERGTTTTTATVAGTSLSEGEYVWPIQINGVTKRVVFDTGSTKSWILGSGGNGPAFNISYVDGSWVAGNTTTGNLTIGGITFQNLTYGLASQTSHATAVDGLLGLSPYPHQYSSTDPTVLAGLVPQLQQPLFGVDMQDSTVDSSGNLVYGTGEVAFGWIDQARYKANSNIAFHPLSKSNSASWSLNVSSFGVPTNDTSAACIFDSGTDVIDAPMAVAQSYWSRVSGAVIKYNSDSSHASWTFPCNTQLPDFTITIGGVNSTVPGKYITWPTRGKASSTCNSRLNGVTGTCWMGQAFFHGQYVVFNYNDKTIGFAPKQ